MEERKKAAYEYLSKCLFSASEYLREAADTIDIESLEVDQHTINTFAAEIESRAKKAQRKAREGK